MKILRNKTRFFLPYFMETGTGGLRTLMNLDLRHGEIFTARPCVGPLKGGNWQNELIPCKLIVKS